ncbi:TolC family protein [Niabella ginsenosidivorans]|uniref:TolC family protein n=1 Tax=Niabella ginsenosidivorans TaxID=1176587 RepID=UPI000A037DED|nr:TolC family protein [Niabella ginsenosidivorans]
MCTFLQRRCLAVVSVVLFFLFFSIPASAQSHLTLLNLIDSSKANLPLFRQKLALIKAAQARITATRHSFLPTLQGAEQLNIGTDNSLSGAVFGLGLLPSASGGINAVNNMDPATGNVAVLSGDYELVNFGLNGARLKAARADLAINHADFNKDLYAVKSKVVLLYLNLLKYEIKLTTDQQNIDRYSSICKVIRALSGSGLIAGADSSMANAELAKARIGYNQTQGIINQYKEQLAFVTGIPSQQIIVDTSFYGHLHPIPPVMNFPIDSIRNPLLDYYNARKNIFRTNELLIRKSYLPKIHLMASAWARGSSIQYNNSYQPLSTGLGYQRYNYLAGLALTYNFLNGIYRKDRLAENRNELEASEQELEQERLALQSQTLQADNDLQISRANLKQIPVQLSSAEVVYKQKLAQYKAGLISLIDLTNASFVLYRSQIDYIEANTDWYLALLNKAVSTGTLDQFIQSLNLEY